MSTPAIRVENLSKMYRLGEVGTGTLSHDLNRWWHKVRGQEDPYLKVGVENDRTQKNSKNNYVWALREINFDVNQGEVLGIIGKNGAGKSTLLKLLSKVSGPTVGTIKAKGRIASLLEVGTGFHPELTGRENIFLNGTILGMTRIEVKQKLDEIIDFSGVARYLDTPVKRYSSGMKVRLGFAVAAHLEPEILIVDEVLAVGDADFQKKAIGKMQEVSQGQGRTVLFVSHNMESVKRLCNRGVIMERGRITYEDTDMRKVVDHYLGFDDQTKVIWENLDGKNKNPYFTPLRLWLSDKAGNELGESLRQNQEVYFNMRFKIEMIDAAMLIGCRMFTMGGEPIFTTFASDTHPDTWPKIELGENTLRFKVPTDILNTGKYKLTAACRMHEKEWIIMPTRSDVGVFFDINELNNESPYYLKSRPNLLAPIIGWEKITY